MSQARYQRRGSDELARYVDAIRRAPPLSRSDEHDLAVRARNGDAEAKRTLVQHNLAFAVAIACRQRRGSVRLEDVIQEGCLGLIRAVDKFDPDAGTRFSTYAVWWIRAYVGRYLKEARSSVRPKSGLIAQCDLSLDSHVSEEDGVTYIEWLAHDGPDAEVAYGDAERDREVRRALRRVRRRLGDLRWDIVHSRLGAADPDTLEQIGTRWGLSRERVRQVEGSTKRFLRGYLQDRTGA